MASRPKPRMKATDLDPRRVVVYFKLAYQVENVREDRNDSDSPTHDLAKEPWADPNRSNDLERQALRELWELLGVRISTEGTGDNDVDCKIFSVSTWYDVDRLWDKIQRKTTGGDDVITLDTPYMEASNFILYPRGVNGPRFGPGERDGSIQDWIEEHTPSPKIEDSVTAVAGGVLLATWSDGTGLWRVRSIPEKPIFRNTVRLELWRDGGRLASLSLWGAHPYTDYEWEVAKDDLVSESRRRLLWFLLRNIPSSVIMAFIVDSMVDDLGFPRVLPDAFSVLREDLDIEESAQQTHREVVIGRIVGDKGLFERVRAIVGREGEGKETDNENGYSFSFDTVEGNRYWLFHGRLRRPEVGGGRWAVGEAEYEPNWAVKTRWIEDNDEPASWYVLNNNSTVTGAGRTPLEALLDEPSLVFPGGLVEWEAQKTDPGVLVFDPEVHLLLGEWPPALWEDDAFFAFVRSGEL